MKLSASLQAIGMKLLFSISFKDQDLYSLIAVLLACVYILQQGNAMNEKKSMHIFFMRPRRRSSRQIQLWLACRHLARSSQAAPKHSCDVTGGNFRNIAVVSLQRASKVTATNVEVFALERVTSHFRHFFPKNTRLLLKEYSNTRVFIYQ